MNSADDLASVLGAYMERERRSVSDLATLCDLPKRTIENWRSGIVKHPRKVADILVVAARLPLNATDTDRLLLAAGWPTITELWSRAQQDGDLEIINLLATWSERNDEVNDNPLVIAYRVLEDLPVDDQVLLPEITSLPVQSRMPLHRNPLFVGREFDLKRLAKALKQQATIAIGSTTATTGIGGVGKTNLATEFVHRYGQFFAGGVFWLNFGIAAGIPEEVAACGGPKAMQLFSDSDGLSLQEQVDRVLRAWQEPMPRLLVFDNCADEELISRWKPTSGGCRVLITSRRSHWSAVLGITTLPLGVFSRGESISLLRKHRPDLLSDNLALNAIAEELGDLPLALHLAGSFLETYKDDPPFGDPEDLLKELRDKSLIDHDAMRGIDVTPSPTNHELHIARTFLISYRRLSDKDPTDALALDMLAGAAYFAPGESVPRNVLLESARGLYAQERETQRVGARALKRLTSLGLLESREHEGLTLHRMVGAFVQHASTDRNARGRVENTLYMHGAAATGEANPFVIRDLHHHLRFVTDSAIPRGDELAGHLCDHLADYLLMMGDTEGALRYLEEAVRIYERTQKTYSPFMTGVLGKIGGVHRKRGDLLLARRYLERAVNQGFGDYSIPNPRNELVSILIELGDTHAAEHYLSQRRKDHEDNSIVVDIERLVNLAKLHFAHGDDELGSEFLEKACRAGDKIFGFMFGNALNALSDLLVERHRYVDARKYLEKALRLDEQVPSGPGHPNAMARHNNLGMLLLKMGNYSEARHHLETALAFDEEHYGPEHYRTTPALINLACLYGYQGDYETAIPLSEHALEIRLRTLGKEHPETKQAEHNLQAMKWAAKRNESLPPSVLQAVNSLPGAIQYVLPSGDVEKIERILSGLDPEIRDSAIRSLSIINTYEEQKTRLRSPVEIFASLPKSIQDAFEREDADALQRAIASYPEAEQDQILSDITILHQYITEQQEFEGFLQNLLSLVVHVAQGNDTGRLETEQILRDLENQGWHLYDPVQLIWRGERDQQTLLSGLDEAEAAFVKLLLQILNEQYPELDSETIQNQTDEQFIRALSDATENVLSTEDAEEKVAFFAKQIQESRADGVSSSTIFWMTILGGFYKYINKISDSIAVLEEALSFTRVLDDVTSEIAVLSQLGNIYVTHGQPHRALELHQRLLEIARVNNNQEAELGALSDIASAWYELGVSGQVIAFASQALALSRQLNNPGREAQNLGNLGRAYAALSEHARARAYYEQALPLMKKIGNRQGEANLLEALGHDILSSGDPDQALKCFEEALSICRTLRDRCGECSVLGAIGLAYRQLGASTRAIEAYQESIIVASEVSDLRIEWISRSNLGTLYQEIGQFGDAQHQYDRALLIVRQLADRRGESTVLNNIAAILQATGRHTEAVIYYEDALRSIRLVGDPLKESRIIWNLGNSLWSTGSQKRAISLLEQAVAVEKALGLFYADNHAEQLAEMKRELLSSLNK